MTRTFAILGLVVAAPGGALPALAQSCANAGADVSCDDGRRGVLSGETIIWSDGTRSSLTSPDPSVIVGNRSSVRVGQGVIVGKGSGVVPTENPSDPRRARCPVLDVVAYCYWANDLPALCSDHGRLTLGHSGARRSREL